MQVIQGRRYVNYEKNTHFPVTQVRDSFLRIVQRIIESTQTRDLGIAGPSRLPREGVCWDADSLHTYSAHAQVSVVVAKRLTSL